MPTTTDLTKENTQLKKDIANINVDQFIVPLTFRLRAKTHHTNPIYAYSFFAVINAYTKKIKKSSYDIEEFIGDFPPFIK